MKLSALALPLAAAATLAACGGDSSLTIENDSSYALTEVYLAPVDTVTWGPDLLRGDILLPGEQLVIDSVDCDTYDVMVVDDTDTDCVLSDLDLCFDDALWRIDDIDLAICAF